MTIVMESLLTPAWWLTCDEIEARYQAALEITRQRAENALKTTEVIARDTLPSDLGETNEIWVEQISATANAYENSLIAAQSVADEVFVGLYGLIDTSVTQMVGAIRLEVGNARKLQISLFPIISDSHEPRYRTGFLRSPVVIDQNITLTIQQYVRAAAPQAAFSSEIAWLGVTVERVGRRIQP